MAAGSLLGVVLVAILLAGLLAFYALTASAPGSFDVTGTVSLGHPTGGPTRGAGVAVLATVESGATFQTATAADGSFALGGLPTGGITLRFTDPGYATVVVYAFVSTLYSAGATGLEVTLGPGNGNMSSSFSLTPFSDLEQFVAALGAGVLLLGVVAGVAAYAALLTLRYDRPALGVVGGGAGMLAPVALALLSLGDPFPEVLAGSAGLALLGGFALALRAVQMAQTGPAAT